MATVWPRSLTARRASASISHSSQDGGPSATPSLRVRRLSREAATVQPQSPGRRETNRTARTMPGSAPRTATGPVRQCPRRPLSIVGCSSPG